MTVESDEIIRNCPKCFSSEGYGIKLNEERGLFVCALKRDHKFVVKDGFMRSG